MTYRQVDSAEYVTHSTCGGVLETAFFTDDVEQLLYVYCPTCEDVVSNAECPGDESYYLVRKPG